MIQQMLSARTKGGSPGVTIAPSVLSADFSKLGSEVRSLVKAGCPWIHLDIMDNQFVPNLTFGPPVVAAVRKASKRAFFDAHLMVQNPEPLIEPFAKAGVQHLTVHVEACSDHLLDVLRQVRACGMTCGVSIKPKTPVSSIEEVLGELQLVLVMTVEPGFGGQALIPSCVNKIRSLRRIRERRNHQFIIQGDGGINRDTIGLVAAAGCEVMVAGSAVFQDGKLAENIQALQKAAQNQ